MPFSDSQGKDVIRGWVKEIQPTTVLDIGPGAGAYSELVTEALDKRPWQMNAVEIWEPYIEKFNLESKYDEVWVDDIRTIDLNHIECYDLVIMGDVIEHMTKEEAKAVILRLTAKSSFENRNVIISFPVLHLDQGPYEGNPYETHVDHWTYNEMMEFCLNQNIKVAAAGHGDVLAWFWLRVDSRDNV